MERRGLLLAVLAALARMVLGDAQCYGVSGQKSSGSPCSSTATGMAGSHAACCDESKQEACLSTGLCYATQRNDNNTFWAEGCTDPTGLDPSCPQYCGASSTAIPTPLQTSYTMLFCGSGSWCCCFDSFGKRCNMTDCCTRNFTLARGLGSVVRQFTTTGDATVVGVGSAAAGSSSASSTNGAGGGGGGGGSRGGGDCDSYRGSKLISAIIGGALGSLLLASLVAFGFSFSRNRQLRRQVEMLQSQNAKTQSLILTTQGIAPPRTSLATNKEDGLVSPISYHEHARTRTPSVSFHRGSGGVSSGGPPSTPGGGFSLAAAAAAATPATSAVPPTPLTPSWTRQGSFRRTAELAGPPGVSELPAEKYTG